MLFHVLLYRLLGFANVDGKNDQALIAELFVEPLDERPLILAIDAPRGPELQQNHLALDGLVVELLASGGGGVETWRRFFGFAIRRVLRKHAAGVDCADQEEQQESQF